MITKEQIKTVQTSYGRCLSKGNVIEGFYNNFLEASPEVREKFNNTDFEEQYKLLRHGINLMIMYADQNIVGNTGLKRIQHTHNRYNMNIKPGYYQLWKAALLQTIPAYDRKFDEETRLAWIKVIDEGIRFIISGY